MSIYLPNEVDPNLTLQKIPTQILASKCILAGDLNNKSPIWGSSQLNDRGLVVHDFLEMNNLQCINIVPHERTFQRAHSSHIDATFLSLDIVDLLEIWNILPQEWFHSGHKAIHFEIDISRNSIPTDNTTSYYDFKNTDQDKLKKSFGTLIENFRFDHSLKTKEQIDLQLETITTAITSAIHLSTPKISKHLVNNSWWTPQLSSIQEKLNKAFNASASDKHNRNKKNTIKLFAQNIKKPYKRQNQIGLKKNVKHALIPSIFSNHSKRSNPSTTSTLLMTREIL